MPKIEVNEKLFFNLLSEKYDYDTLEKKLTCAKAELDEKPNPAEQEDKRIIKIELNDTNRPDLWSTNGIARQLRLHGGKKAAEYNKFMSKKGDMKDCKNRTVYVEPELKEIRPFMVAFVISGKPIDEPMLLDIIQTQEKLAWNFGRKRKSLSMGVYREEHIQFPVHYKKLFFLYQQNILFALIKKLLNLFFLQILILLLYFLHPFHLLSYIILS